MKPVVVVAGVGPGIGTSIARAFGAEGFRIALLARDSARLAKRHAEIAAAGITAAPFIVDLADSAATLNAVEQVGAWAGGSTVSFASYHRASVAARTSEPAEDSLKTTAQRMRLRSLRQLTTRHFMR